jgi:hypothetical protein
VARVCKIATLAAKLDKLIWANLEDIGYGG